MTNVKYTSPSNQLQMVEVDAMQLLEVPTVTNTKCLIEIPSLKNIRADQLQCNCSFRPMGFTGLALRIEARTFILIGVWVSVSRLCKCIVNYTIVTKMMYIFCRQRAFPCEKSLPALVSKTILVNSEIVANHA